MEALADATDRARNAFALSASKPASASAGESSEVLEVARLTVCGEARQKPANDRGGAIVPSRRKLAKKRLAVSLAEKFGIKPKSIKTKKKIATSTSDLLSLDIAKARAKKKKKRR